MIHRRHRAVEFKKFLIKIDKEVSADLDVHIVCGNYSTHKTPLIKNWLTAHPRFQIHFTPTGSAWINQVERWFAYLTGNSSNAASTKTFRPSRPTAATGPKGGTKTPNHSSGQNRRPNPRIHRPTNETNYRRRTLGVRAR